MRAEVERVANFVQLVVLVLVIALAWVYDSDTKKLRQERDGLRAQVAALRAADGDASCAVARNGPRVLCALRGDRLQRSLLADGDLICYTVLKNQNRVECTLADGRLVTLRREATRRLP